MDQWTLDMIPLLDDKVAVITGGSHGVGFEVARELSRRGARVIMAGEDINEGIEAVKKISDEFPTVDITFEAVDFDDLESVEFFAGRLKRNLDTLDLLIFCESLSNLPEREETSNHFEKMFGVNYLFHFALAAELYPLYSANSDSRIVMMTGMSPEGGKINFTDLNSEEHYDPYEAYAQSKLALLLFTKELHRMGRSSGKTFKSIAAYPGPMKTGLFHLKNSLKEAALPILFAATSPEAQSGELYGPHGLKVTSDDVKTGSKLWKESEKLIGSEWSSSF